MDTIMMKKHSVPHAAKIFGMLLVLSALIVGLRYVVFLPRFMH